MTDRPQRNMVQRLDGRMVNAGRRRGMLVVCATGCCCGRVERGFAPVPADLYHQEWERRRLRNLVHLNQGGCLGPCALANVAMLLVDGRPYWFHSLNDEALIGALYDYTEALLEAGRHVAPPPLLAPHLFNGFGWEAAAAEQPPAPEARPAEAAAPVLGEGVLLLTQADTDLLTLEQARALLPADFAPIQAAQIGALEDDAAAERLLDGLLPQAAVVLVRLLGGARSFAAGLERLQRWAAASGGFLLCMPAADALDPDLMARSTVGVPLAHLISAYFQCGGSQNLADGLQCLSDHLLLTGWGYDPPRELPRHGLYEPPLAAPPEPSAPAVGLLFYRAHLLSGNTAFVDALAEGLAARGLRARAVYTQSLKECDAAGRPLALELLTRDGPLDGLICTLSFALGDGEGAETLRQLDLPIIQAISASAPREQWARAGRGLGPLDTAMNVAIPEFDGRIISVPVSFKQPDAAGGGARYEPDRERVARAVGLAARLAALRRKPNAEKRIAFILTNSSAKAQRVGNAVGLDAPASLLRVLHAMRAAGYRVSGLPPTSDQLLLDLIDRCSYDQTWLSEAQLARAWRVGESEYQGWFAELPAERRADMARQWGEPPGAAYRHGDGLALAGQEFGNVLVALQPPRGYDMDPNAIYHRPDLPPPHSYYALYRWLREVWGADAIVHMGKHGTLEWLPGKGVGLSGACYPDLLLDDLPLVYPFIINDPGEGSQAKRRGHAVVVDHMTPPMTSAGAYGALAELAQLVDEYYQVERLDPSKLPLLQRQIWDVIQANRLDDDLRYILRADHGDHSHDWDGTFLDDGTPTAFAELEGREVAHLLEDIEGYLCELAGAQIRDGLHILGELPAGPALAELLFHLLKLPNLDVPSLPAAVAAAAGEDWAALQEHPGRRRSAADEGRTTEDEGASADEGRTTNDEGHRVGDQGSASLSGPDPLFSAPAPQRSSAPTLDSSFVLRPSSDWQTDADAIAWVEERAKALLAELERRGWDTATLGQVVAEAGFAGPQPQIAAALEFACAQIVPKLHEGARDEVAHLLRALEGGFVPPGPSGAPTRGMAHVLPTGRNFYAVDPRALPSVASWQVGQGLAEDLLRRYLREEGGYPASVGISIWGTSAMRTSGDDIAQVLALLGARPRWQRENRRVLGVELIPLAELGRPRVDVVCRISGFFRDAFPHLIALLDQAFEAAVGADEPPEQNFPRRHALAAEARLLAEGRPAEAAREEARFRIFGCAPGSYGAGILPLIDAGNWQSDADFAAAYLTWGGYAYSGVRQGAPAREAFARALGGVQVATKNQDNREHDIFDSDDYLQFHGGMIAAIRALSGANPRRYFGDSSEPARPRTRDLREEARRVYRSRVVNPKWIASMRRHGYKGALELAATVDYLFGYDATAQVLDDWMYHGVVESYLRDEEMQQFFADSNPWAWQAIAERLIEAIDRGLWRDPDPLDEQLLRAAKSHGLRELEHRQRR